MYAARNIDLCTKDCLCLFVCPTGATDTENGQIDKNACLDGCRLCVDACPSHAIYLVYTKYPEPKEKNPEVSEKLTALMEKTYNQELMVKTLGNLLKIPVNRDLPEPWRNPYELWPRIVPVRRDICCRKAFRFRIY